MNEEKLNEIKEKMCIDYCKYPGNVPFGFLKVMCDRCPMNEMERILKEGTDADNQT